MRDDTRRLYSRKSKSVRRRTSRSDKLNQPFGQVSSGFSIEEAGSHLSNLLLDGEKRALSSSNWRLR